MQRRRHVYYDLRHNVRMNLYNGIASSIAMNLVIPFVGIFAIKLGANNFEVSLLSALPALVAIIVTVPGSAFIDRISDKKRAIGTLILSGRFFFVLMALVPFFPEHIRPMALIVVYALMNLPISIMSVAWQSFIADIIPLRQRSSVFAVRNIWISIAGAVVVVAGGWLLDVIPFPTGYQIVFIIAFLAALFEWRYFISIRENKVTAAAKASQPQEVSLSLRDILNQALHEPNFSRFSITTLLYHFSWMMAWPVFTVYKVDVLGANNTWMSIYTLAASMASVLFFRYWGKLADKRGNKPVLSLAAMGLGLTPLVWLFIHSLELAAVADFIGGVFTAGFNLVFFNRLLEIVPDKGRTSYIAFVTTLIQIAATISPLVGIWLYESLGFAATMIITAIFRVIAGWLYFRL